MELTLLRARGEEMIAAGERLDTLFEYGSNFLPCFTQLVDTEVTRLPSGPQFQIRMTKVERHRNMIATLFERSNLSRSLRLSFYSPHWICRVRDPVAEVIQRQLFDRSHSGPVPTLLSLIQRDTYERKELTRQRREERPVDEQGPEQDPEAQPVVSDPPIKRFKGSQSLAATCSVCYDAPVASIVSVPCGHMVMCEQCQSRTYNMPGVPCVFCRTPVQSFCVLRTDPSNLSSSEFK